MTVDSQSDLNYSEQEQSVLLRIARRGLDLAVLPDLQQIPSLDLAGLPERLQQWRACFVTLQYRGDLRGCTGTLVPRQSLAGETFESTIKTARSDPRFDPVSADEVPDIALSISILTVPKPLAYDSPGDLIARLRPGIDGVTFAYGIQRGTFLPQVWDKVNDPVDFLSRLCQKMGLPRTWWLANRMQVEVYQAVEVSEPGYLSD